MRTSVTLSDFNPINAEPFEGSQMFEFPFFVPLHDTGGVFARNF